MKPELGSLATTTEPLVLKSLEFGEVLDPLRRSQIKLRKFSSASLLFQ